MQLLLSKEPLEASVIVASTGSTAGSVTPVFNVAIELDPSRPVPSYTAPLRYGPLAEIHHIFRADPKNPPKAVSLIFSLAVVATVPALMVAVSARRGLDLHGVGRLTHAQWLVLGANVSHASKALGSAPLSHAIFFGSIVAMEGVFFLYYSRWNLFQIGRAHV